MLKVSSIVVLYVISSELHGTINCFLAFVLRLDIYDSSTISVVMSLS